MKEGRSCLDCESLRVIFPVNADMLETSLVLHDGLAVKCAESEFPDGSLTVGQLDHQRKKETPVQTARGMYGMHQTRSGPGGRGLGKRELLRVGREAVQGEGRAEEGPGEKASEAEAD